MKKIYVSAAALILSTGLFAQTNGKLTMSASQGGEFSAQVVVTPGVEDLTQNQMIDIYSFNNNIFINPINFTNLNGQIEVYDLNGKLIISESLTNNLIQLNFDRVGIYLVTVKANDQIFTEKVFLR